MMNWLFSLLLTVHILVALAIIGLVLMQHGKGADMGAAFGSGASGSLFGSSGSANFLSRTTGGACCCLFSYQLVVGVCCFNKPKTTGSVMQDAVQSQTVTPATSSAPDASPAAPVIKAPRRKKYRSKRKKDLVGISPR
jgi:preprotein translocase subunit SecG